MASYSILDVMLILRDILKELKAIRAELARK